MNGRRAKAIRRKVFRDISIRGTKYMTLTNGMVVSDDLRRAYQYEKKGKDLRYESGRFK